MTRIVNNNGIGALYATFDISKTGEDFDLTVDDVGKAVALSGDNAIGLGSDGGKLLGRLEHVSGGLSTTQINGIARFDINTSEAAPAVGDAVVVDGAGKVYQAPAVDGASGDPAGGNVARGIALAVDSANNTCDVLL